MLNPQSWTNQYAWIAVLIAIVTAIYYGTAICAYTIEIAEYLGFGKKQAHNSDADKNRLDDEVLAKQLTLHIPKEQEFKPTQNRKLTQSMRSALIAGTLVEAGHHWGQIPTDPLGHTVTAGTDTVLDSAQTALDVGADGLSALAEFLV